MGGFLRFEKMITPIFIQIIFWISVIVSIVGGLGVIIFGLFFDSGNFLHAVGGIFAIIIGPIIARIYCELLIVIFKIQSSLIEIRDVLRDDTDYDSTPPLLEEDLTDEFDEM